MSKISIKNDLVLNYIESLEDGTKVSVRELSATLQVSEGTGLCPLGIKRSVLLKHDPFPVRKTAAAAVRLCVPFLNNIVFPGEGLSVKGSLYACRNLLLT